MNIAKPLLISFSLLAFASASAYAAGDAREESASQSASSGASSGKSGQSQQQSQMRTSELIGAQVRDSQGKELGEIEDVVLDLQGGKVHAAVLSFGGILGMGEKNYAFPISQLKPGKRKDQFTMNVDKQKLEKAEGFAQGQWPAMNDQYWGRVGGQASAGQTKSRDQKKDMNLVRATELEGKDVQDKSGQEVGQIQDVVIDMKSGQLRNIVLDLKDAGEANVQAKALTLGTGDTLVLNMDAKQLKSQAKKSGKQSQPQRQGPGASSGASSEDATSKGISAGAAKPDNK
jgi:sporulation protein YlmC with PRC-barrel domain